MFNKANIGQLMKQAQQMQENLKKTQEQLAHIDVEGQAGGGMVKIVMNCQHVVKRVSLEASVLSDDKEMLEDLIAAAVNDAIRKVEQTSQEKMATLTTGLNLPPGVKLPF